MDYDIGLVKRRRIISPDECYFAVPAAGPGSTNAWNNSDKDAGITLSGSPLLTLTKTAGGGLTTGVRAINSASSGKKFWTLHADTAATPAAITVGFANSSWGLSVGFLGADTGGFGWAGDGNVYFNNAPITTIQGWAQSDTLGIALDMDFFKLWLQTNGGNWNNDVIGNQNPATNTGGISFTHTGGSAPPYFAAACGSAINDAFTANFSPSSPPSGFGFW